MKAFYRQHVIREQARESLQRDGFRMTGSDYKLTEQRAKTEPKPQVLRMRACADRD